MHPTIFFGIGQIVSFHWQISMFIGIELAHSPALSDRIWHNFSLGRLFWSAQKCSIVVNRAQNCDRVVIVWAVLKILFYLNRKSLNFTFCQLVS